MAYNFIVLLLYCTLCIADKRLRFNAVGKFKIVQFTDLHYGYDEYENQQTAIVQDTILEAEKPDLVVMTGDMVSGYEWKRGDRDWFKHLWEKLAAPMIKHNIPWAMALGNHDVEGELHGKQIVELDRAYELSYTQLGPQTISGASNYYLPIYLHDSQDFTVNDIGQMLWIFDSGSNGCLGVKGWGCIMYDQVAWYRNLSRTFSSSRHGRTIPSLAFFHIPLYEHLDLWNVQGVQGDLGDEGVCCSAINTGLYATMKEMGDIKGVYCGHDHSNDYIGNYHGIMLGYGRKTGYGCYGPPFGWKHGARVLEITQNDFGARTWLRLEDGTIEIQKHNALSWRKFLGCCSMEGHGRVAMTWLNYLMLFITIAVVVSVITFLVRSVWRYYRKQRRIGLKTLDNSSNDGVNRNWEAKLTHLWGDNEAAATASRPRQRRVNELETV